MVSTEAAWETWDSNPLGSNEVKPLFPLQKHCHKKPGKIEGLNKMQGLIIPKGPGFS